MGDFYSEIVKSSENQEQREIKGNKERKKLHKNLVWRVSLLLRESTIESSLVCVGEGRPCFEFNVGSNASHPFLLRWNKKKGERERRIGLE
jgi:hypothetical protein